MLLLCSLVMILEVAVLNSFLEITSKHFSLLLCLLVMILEVVLVPIGTGNRKRIEIAFIAVSILSEGTHLMFIANGFRKEL